MNNSLYYVFIKSTFKQQSLIMPNLELISVDALLGTKYLLS